MRANSRWLWALIALSSALQIVMFPIAGPVPLWRSALSWFALAPFLVALLREQLTLRQSALLGYACGFFWYLGNCYWIYQTMYLYGGLPKPAALGILILFSLYLGLYHALFAVVLVWLRRGLGLKYTLLLSPVLWVAVELARSRITGFPWDLLGYTQVDNTLLTLLAPVGGVMLLSFIIALVNAMFAFAWTADIPAKRLQYAAVALVLAVGVQLGVFYHPPADPAIHTATLLQENLAVGVPGKVEERMALTDKFKLFSDLSRHPEFVMEEGTPTMHWMEMADQPPPSIIVWPEAPSDFWDGDAGFQNAVSGLAQQMHSPIIANDVSQAPRDPDGATHLYNSARFIRADGSYAGRYDKMHLVPFGEYTPYKQLFFFAGHLLDDLPFIPGARQTTFETAGQNYGVFICYESIFGDAVRQLAANGSTVLVNVSDDGWYGDTSAPWEHLNMARMRAIENRRWVLRDTNTGVTTAIDPHGRGIFSTPRHVRAAYGVDFDYRADQTFYTRHGDWFAWLCAALTLAGFLLAFKSQPANR